MSLEPSVAVIILNWNGKELLSRFLPGIVKTKYNNLQLIVGDNASTDGSSDFIKNNFPEIRVIHNNKNYGFAEGYNRIIKEVDADYYVLLNSDVEVTDNWITPVIQAMEADKNIAVAQPKIKWLNNKSKFEYAGGAGGFIDRYYFTFCRGRIFDQLENDYGQYDDEREIFWASGAAFFIKRNNWEESGGLDADLFAHMEEIDLCWRLKNLGYKIMYCPGAVVYHLGGGTLDSKNPYKLFLNFRNNLIIMQKNLPLAQAIIGIAIRICVDFIALLHFLLKGEFKFARAVNKAHVRFFIDIIKTSRKRGKQQQKYFNHTGVYPSSIVWDYFVKKIKFFSQLKDFQ